MLLTQLFVYLHTDAIVYNFLTAWERGLRQAKEMKRLSQQRKETDIEYEEKRTTMSLTQAELDRENDYYTRPASPLHENEDDFMDDFDDVPRLRRVAPPPPSDFQSSRPTRRYPPLEHHASPPPPSSSSRRSHQQQQRYSPSPPPPSSGRIRRVAPPRSPERDAPRGGDVGGPRHRRGDEWADPWMRGGEPKERASARKRSYSSGSSRSSSKSSSRSRSRSPKRKRRGRSSSRSSRYLLTYTLKSLFRNKKFMLDEMTAKRFKICHIFGI